MRVYNYLFSVSQIMREKEREERERERYQSSERLNSIGPALHSLGG